MTPAYFYFPIQSHLTALRLSPRLVGPYADPERSAEVYKRQPLGDLLESTITASFLLTAKVLSMLGFKSFQPNSF